MGTWLFIGVVFAAVLGLALLCGRSRARATPPEQDSGPGERIRQADAMAADAARMADARMPPFQGGYPV